ncbi:MAG: class I SAM-dependent methyltransferase [Candidatus Hydrogenedentota bacterium]
MKRVLLGIASRIPLGALERLLHGVVRDRVLRLPASEALRFLFRLDAVLYEVQGTTSVAYGDGIHSKHRHMNYHSFFVKRIRPDDKVLDLGCGIGAVAFSVASETGAAVTGVDWDAGSIETARARHQHPRLAYSVSDVSKDIPDGRYDVVILSNVLEHLRERPVFLRRIAGATRASRFLIRVPLFERDWRVPLKKELGVEWRLDPTHETEFTQETFASEMAEAGMRIADQEFRWGEIWAEVVPEAAASERTESSRSTTRSSEK